MPMLRLTLSSSSPAGAGGAEGSSGRSGGGGARRAAAHEPGGAAAQQLVADRVAERVVDALEVVEVDEHHGHLARGARLERLAHLLAEQRAVRGAGERGGGGLGLQ